MVEEQPGARIQQNERDKSDQNDKAHRYGVEMNEQIQQDDDRAKCDKACIKANFLKGVFHGGGPPFYMAPSSLPRTCLTVRMSNVMSSHKLQLR